MAASFETTEKVTREDTFWLAAHDIDIDAANNGRAVLPDITELIRDIEARGQTTPCVVRKNGQRAVMVEGHSRWRAIVDINKRRKPDQRLKVWCSLFRGNEIDALIHGFSANRLRNALTAVDEGYFVQRMLKYGKDMGEIASIVNQPVEWCKKRLKLVELVPEAQKAVSDGSLKPSAAVALTKLSADLQRQAVKDRNEKGKVKPVRTAAKPRVKLPQLRLSLDGLIKDREIPKGLDIAKVDDTAIAVAKWVLKQINAAA